MVFIFMARDTKNKHLSPSVCTPIPSDQPKRCVYDIYKLKILKGEGE
jgi:hypothetical protein